MNELLQIVLDSTKKALNKESIILNESTDEKSFLSLLKSSGLSGVVLPYIDSKYRSTRFNTLAKSILFEYITRDDKQMKLIQKTNSILNQNHIKHIYLKGSHLKTLYPHTYMRGMGDIDILVEESNLLLVRNIFQEHHITLDIPSLAHDLYRDNDQMIIEVHPRIFNDFNPKYGEFFKGVWENAELKDEDQYTLEPSFELVYLLYHLAKHMESSGIGLRSILDIGIFMSTYESKIDTNKLYEKLNQAQMIKFYETIMYMIDHLYGINTKHRDQTFLMSDELKNQMSDYLVSSGIHGQGETFNVMVPKLANTKNRKKSRLRILFRIMFPEYKVMISIYPSIKKFFLLYLYFCFVRWYKLIIKNFKSSMFKIKNMRRAKKDKEKTLIFFDQIGLN